MSTYHEQRRSIMELADHLNKQRVELLSAVNSLNISISALVSESERLFPTAIQEVGEGKVAKYTTKNPSPKDVADHVNPGRTCGQCGEPGHDRRNCPNAHRVRAQKQAEVAARPEKKKRQMKPLTEDQKAQRRKSLEKARAARGKRG